MRTDIKTIMVQGTASHVGKSLITAAFCRILKNRGFRVSPFKAQNMALNSFVTMDGAEIGRAQALQAEAAGVEPTVDMNPILLKPTGDAVSQVIIHGKVIAQMKAKEYHEFKREAFAYVLESIERLFEENDVLVIEGAGSPAEINLRENDIVNMGLAEKIDAPVVLVGDIDRGGVFAAIVGTLELLSASERARVKGIIINKFRGDKTLLEPGLKFLEDRLGIPVLGVVPHMGNTGLPDEDGVSLDDFAMEKGFGAGAKNLPLINIVVMRLPRISNFTDFDPLKEIDDIALRYMDGPVDLSAMKEADLVILPGTKNVISDLAWLYEIGFKEALDSYLATGGRLFGICGGFQMLGRSIKDPDGVEGTVESAEGFSLLDMETVLKTGKETSRVEAVLQGADEIALEGYEIHMGETVSRERPFARITRRNKSMVEIEDGAVSADQKVFGTYMHGIFDNDLWRTGLLNTLRQARGIAPAGSGAPLFKASREAAIERLARVVEEHVDMDALFEIAGLRLTNRSELS